MITLYSFTRAASFVTPDRAQTCMVMQESQGASEDAGSTGVHACGKRSHNAHRLLQMAVIVGGAAAWPACLSSVPNPTVRVQLVNSRKVGAAPHYKGSPIT